MKCSEAVIILFLSVLDDQWQLQISSTPQGWMGQGRYFFGSITAYQQKTGAFGTTSRRASGVLQGHGKESTCKLKGMLVFVAANISRKEFDEARNTVRLMNPNISHPEYRVLPQHHTAPCQEKRGANGATSIHLKQAEWLMETKAPIDNSLKDFSLSARATL